MSPASLARRSLAADPLPLASYKIWFESRRVRAVPAGLDGPGVDVLDAEEILIAARPMLDWLEAREPGVVVRSISVRLDAERRVLVSIASEPKPRALRFAMPYADELRDAGRDAERAIGEACVTALARRRA